MSQCPTIHEHPEFITSYDPTNSKQEYIIKKLRRFLTSESGHAVGEQLKHEFAPFKSYPRGQNPIRCLFILCKDCKQEALDPKCAFCQSDMHSKDDAVLFYIAKHEKSYKKEGRRLALSYLKKDRFSEVRKPNRRNNSK